MAFPERFSNLPEYAFPRLRALLDPHPAGGEQIAMTIGEPRHAMPPFVAEVLNGALAGFGRYPDNNGAPDLLEAIRGWLGRRYGVDMPVDRLMALNGTREGLFNAAIALCPEVKNGQKPVVLTPNPFYQVYAVAALTAGAEPVFLPATSATGHLPDFGAVDSSVLDRTAIAYICSPANPQGAVASRDYWADLLALAEKHDFQIFADECYAEIYRDAPLPQPLQAVATAAWNDEAHVAESRAMYQRKYAIADEIFGGLNAYMPPEAGFFLWLPVADGEAAALKLWRETGVRVLPGAYLSRDANGENPGAGYIRVALVASEEETRRGLTLLRDCLYA